jgi:hypothetical protein
LNAATPSGITAAPTAPARIDDGAEFLANEQRFNPAPNAPSAFVNQGYLQAGVPLVVQPFGFPTASDFRYAYSQQGTCHGS